MLWGYDKEVEVIFCPLLPIYKGAFLFLEVSQDLPLCPSGKCNMCMKMSMKHWWGDTDKEKPKHSEKNLLQWYFFHYKSHMD